VADAATEAQYHLSVPDLKALWARAGGAKKWADLMAAIAVAESGRWVTVENVAGHATRDLNYAPPYTAYSPTGDYSIGLWQINFYRNLGPARAKRYAELVSGPYAGNPTKFAQWLRTQKLAQAKIARQLMDDGRGLSNWNNDPAYEAWKTGGDAALEPWIGPTSKVGAGGPTGPTGGGTTGAGNGPPPGVKGPVGEPTGEPPVKEPKHIVRPWDDMWKSTKKDTNDAIAAAKAMRDTLVRSVGG
jgi:hypothetical protein